MVIKSVALYTTPRKVCNSIVQKDSCWFQWGLEQSHTHRAFTGSQTIPVFAGMMKLNLQIISTSAMGKQQLHLLDQSKSIAKGRKFALACALLTARGTSTPSSRPVPAPSKAAHPCLQRGGTWAWTEQRTGLSAQQVGGNDCAKDKHKGFRLPLTDDLAINRQTAVAAEDAWKVDKSSTWGKMSVVGKRHSVEVKILSCFMEAGQKQFLHLEFYFAKRDVIIFCATQKKKK